MNLLMGAQYKSKAQPEKKKKKKKKKLGKNFSEIKKNNFIDKYFFE